MRPFLSLLTAVALLLHLWLGCCAHHAHAAKGSSSVAGECASEQQDHDRHHHHSHDHPYSPESSSDPSPACPHNSHDDCHETHCSFVIAAKTTLDLNVLVTDLPPEALLLLANPTLAMTAVVARDDAPEDHLRLPLRLHLFKQVLLI